MSEPTNRERLTLREIAWRDVLPAWRLLATLRLALRVRMLLLGTLGWLALMFGWWLIASLFSNHPDVRPLVAAYQSCPWKGDPTSDTSGLWTGSIMGPHLAREATWPYVTLWEQLSAPVRQMFAEGVSGVRCLFLLACTIWGVLVSAVFGGALTRMAAMNLGREESIGVRDALRFTRQRFGSYLAAPLFPLIALAFISIPLVIAGAIMRSDMGATVVAIAWPLALGVGLLGTLFLLGLLFGWPLMAPAISSEGTDSFDAVSRAYSYVHQRPLHYLLYAVVATLISALGAILVGYFAQAVVFLTAWLVSWGAGNERIFGELHAGGVWPSGSAPLAVKAIAFWNGCVRVVALGFGMSYFWTASTAIYLLLRRDADGAELDQIYFDKPPQEYTLPTLQPDANGVPLAPRNETPPSDAPAAS